MLIQEFQKLTGFYPTTKMYAAIERAYGSSQVSKEEFCAAYKANQDGMAERITMDADLRDLAQEQERVKEVQQLKSAMAAKEENVRHLQQRQERLMAWKPYEDPDNVPQSVYDELRNAGAEELTDREAVDWVADDFGFAREGVCIARTVPKLERNLLRQIRTLPETVERLPLYFASDFNYCRFRTAGIEYEVLDGVLRICNKYG